MFRQEHPFGRRGPFVERVTYHNLENGFCVLRAQVRGHRDVVTVVGHAAAIAAGEWITASGECINDRTHGQQFKARFLRTSPPTSAHGIEKKMAAKHVKLKKAKSKVRRVGLSATKAAAAKKKRPQETSEAKEVACQSKPRSSMS
jgi:exodeoxyribonuclease V alpha subunit